MGCSANTKFKTLENHNAVSFRFSAWSWICMKLYVTFNNVLEEYSQSI